MKSILSVFWVSPKQTALQLIGGVIATFWFGLHPLMKWLVVLIGADILTGVIAACATKTLSSEVSRAGMCRKALMVIMVGVAAIAERILGGGIPLGGITAGFYCVHELISIVENTGRTGLPIPTALTEAITKLKQKSG